MGAGLKAVFPRRRQYPPLAPAGRWKQGVHLIGEKQ
jgi:hypothetical protein